MTKQQPAHRVAIPAQDIRDWARTAGYVIPPQGPIPRDIFFCYLFNHPLPQPSTPPGTTGQTTPE